MPPATQVAGNWYKLLSYLVSICSVRLCAAGACRYSSFGGYHHLRTELKLFALARSCKSCSAGPRPMAACMQDTVSAVPAGAEGALPMGPGHCLPGLHAVIWLQGLSENQLSSHPKQMSLLGQMGQVSRCTADPAVLPDPCLSRGTAPCSI